MKNNLAKTSSPFSVTPPRLNLLLPFSIALVFAFTAVPVDADEGTVISVASGADWTNALARISTDSGGTNTDYKVYILDIQGEVSVPGVSSPSISGRYKTVRLAGSGTLALSSSGSIFRISTYQILIIDGPTLKGRTNNNASLVYVNSSSIELRNGTITGNSSRSDGGGVYVNGGSFDMSGGTITGNSSGTEGGGMYVRAGGFSISGGIITGNSSGTEGGGMYVRAGGFDMSGGIITGNSAGTEGGGMAVSSGSAVMSGGTISANSAAAGGGVLITITDDPGMSSNSKTFTKIGGTIYGDTDNIVGNGNATDNTATATTGTNGNAVLVVIYHKDNREGAYYYYRNETLGDDADGNISIKAELLPAKSGETLNGWTKR
ncbi:MAG: hypothetical protein LBC46_06370 [Treponema sp.]|jgi:hypothetical protein|nr:hypothetical protein [Treponema sp.]